MTVAFLSSQRSKDPNKQVGAVIASESKLILGRFFFILSLLLFASSRSLVALSSRSGVDIFL